MSTSRRAVFDRSIIAHGRATATGTRPRRALTRLVTRSAVVAALAGACTEPLERGADAVGDPAAPSSSSVTTDTEVSIAPDGDPAIVVQTPRPGDEIISPVDVSGSADVPDGTVVILVVDERDRVLASSSATTRCGSGCRGRYGAPLAFHVEDRQGGVIQVLEESEEDSTVRNLVEVPVTLVPLS